MSRRELRWVVTERDPNQLGALLARLGTAAEGALAQGRVFVDGRRTSDDRLRLRPGQTVSLSAARHAPPDEPVRLLGERDGLLAVYKPAGLSTEPDRRGSDSLWSRVAALCRMPETTVHACSRLDHGVSGVVLVAATAAARHHAALERAEGRIQRRYVAVAAAAPSITRGTWQTPVDDRAAITRFACIETLASGPALLAFEPATGRKHQLRIHASRAGSPLLGDEAYGGPRKRVLASGSVLEIRRVLLHAAALTLRDRRGERWRIQAPVAPQLRDTWDELGGRAEAWLEALRENLFGPAREP